MRRPATILLALLAVAALAAAKPAPPADAPEDAVPNAARELLRNQGVSVCIGELRAVPDLSPDDLESICGCAADRFLETNGALQLAEGGRLNRMMAGPLVSCTARTRPDRTSDVARLGIAARRPPPPAMEPPPVDAKPVGGGEAAPAETGSDSGGGFWDWVRSITLPAWLTGASVLWWIAIGIFVFGMLILRIRGRDPRKDLSAPPSDMRRGAPPARPRRPDLPR